MSLDILVMLAVACLLVVSLIVVRVKRSTALSDKQKNVLQKAPEPIRVTVLPSRFNEDKDLIFIEYIPADLHKLVIGFKASVNVQAQLLAAADMLLGNLPQHIRDHLGRPILSDQIEWLLQAGDPQRITPERVRAAMAVAEASQALHALMFEFGCRVDKFSYQIAISEKTGAFKAGRKLFISPYAAKQIMKSTGVSMAMAAEIWCRITKILRDGSIEIPGVRVVQTDSDYADINISA